MKPLKLFLRTMRISINLDSILIFIVFTSEDCKSSGTITTAPFTYRTIFLKHRIRIEHLTSEACESYFYHCHELSLLRGCEMENIDQKAPVLRANLANDSDTTERLIGPPDGFFARKPRIKNPQNCSVRK